MSIGPMSCLTTTETSLPGPKLLVSVRSQAEVETALQGGADWIDLKEPSDGPLAGVSADVARECSEWLAGRRPLSAALGELSNWPHSAAADLLGVSGIGVVKLGLAGCAKSRVWQQGWQEVADASAAENKQLAAVIYADWRQADAPSPAEILALATASDCRYLLIDTFDKSRGRALDYLPSKELNLIVQTARKNMISTVLAGSLTQEMLRVLPLQSIDVIAVRGAVCRGDRAGIVDLELVQKFRKALACSDSAHHDCTGSGHLLRGNS